VVVGAFVALTFGECVGSSDSRFGLADGDGDADWPATVGLGDASVTVIVVTPFDADTLTRAPVAPSRNTPLIAPDFAWSKRDKSFASISPPVLCYVV
jgi:hypothetical protein